MEFDGAGSPRLAREIAKRRARSTAGSTKWEMSPSHSKKGRPVETTFVNEISVRGIAISPPCTPPCSPDRQTLPIRTIRWAGRDSFMTIDEDSVVADGEGGRAERMSSLTRTLLSPKTSSDTATGSPSLLEVQGSAVPLVTFAWGEQQPSPDVGATASEKIAVKENEKDVAEEKEKGVLEDEEKCVVAKILEPAAAGGAIRTIIIVAAGVLVLGMWVVAHDGRVASTARSLVLGPSLPDTPRAPPAGTRRPRGGRFKKAKRVGRKVGNQMASLEVLFNGPWV